MQSLSLPLNASMHMEGVAPSTNTECISIQKKNFSVYEKATIKRGSRWHRLAPKAFKADLVKGNVVRAWFKNSESYHGMKKVRTKRGVDIDTKSGTVTRIEEVNGKFKSNTIPKQCDYHPKGMVPMWLQIG